VPGFFPQIGGFIKPTLKFQKQSDPSKLGGLSTVPLARCPSGYTTNHCLRGSKGSTFPENFQVAFNYFHLITGDPSGGRKNHGI
jgi:hypothetical protein